MKMKLSNLPTLETIARTPVVRAASAQATNRTATRRAELAQQLSAATASHAAESLKHQRNLTTARELVAKRAASLTDAQAAFQAIERAARSADQGYERCRDSVLRELAETESPRIGLLLETCGDLVRHPRRSRSKRVMASGAINFRNRSVNQH